MIEQKQKKKQNAHHSKINTLLATLRIDDFSVGYFLNLL